MIKGIINKLFSKEEGVSVSLPKAEKGELTLKIDNIIVGYLSVEEGEWYFKYSDEFKKQEMYHKIIGFPSLEDEYKSHDLWPFFRIRIPGLKQPAVKEIVEDENIDFENEFELLKRFGEKTIANPYQLVF